MPVTVDGDLINEAEDIKNIAAISALQQAQAQQQAQQQQQNYQTSRQGRSRSEEEKTRDFLTMYEASPLSTITAIFIMVGGFFLYI